MEKFKTIKSYALYTALAVCGFVIWYLIASFALLDLNALNWQSGERFIVGSLGFLTSTILMFVGAMTR